MHEAEKPLKRLKKRSAPQYTQLKQGANEKKGLHAYALDNHQDLMFSVDLLVGYRFSSLRCLGDF